MVIPQPLALGFWPWSTLQVLSLDICGAECLEAQGPPANSAALEQKRGVAQKAATGRLPGLAVGLAREGTSVRSGWEGLAPCPAAEALFALAELAAKPAAVQPSDSGQAKPAARERSPTAELPFCPGRPRLLLPPTPAP